MARDVAHISIAPDRGLPRRMIFIDGDVCDPERGFR